VCFPVPPSAISVGESAIATASIPIKPCFKRLFFHVLLYLTADSNTGQADMPCIIPRPNGCRYKRHQSDTAAQVRHVDETKILHDPQLQDIHHRAHQRLVPVRPDAAPATLWLSPLRNKP
jgi:hypothetical protein